MANTKSTGQSCERNEMSMTYNKQSIHQIKRLQLSLDIIVHSLTPLQFLYEKNPKSNLSYSQVLALIGSLSKHSTDTTLTLTRLLNQNIDIGISYLIFERIFQCLS